MHTRRSWREKMDNPKLPKLVAIPPNMRPRYGTGRMLIPHPREVEAVIRATAEGTLITISQIRGLLAARHAAEVTCPLTTGIFIRIAAEAAAEEERAGAAEITPYWRVVRDDGALNPKFPGGVERQAERLRAEGHRIVAGRPPRVAAVPRQAGLP